jgi:hypothetical protein
LLGRRWWDLHRIDVRVLTDADECGLNGQTMRRLAQRAKVHGLRGLHSKLYIIDDEVLLTSANLTASAFSARYETGAWLNRKQSDEMIRVFEEWWKGLSRRLDPESLRKIASRKSPHFGEDLPRMPLTRLHALPPDPGDFGEHNLSHIFGDYEPFLQDYRVLAGEYKKHTRVWPYLPLYFELDGFLSYLFRDHPKRPSRPYTKLPVRQLTSSTRTRELRRFLEEFRCAATANSRDGRWRVDHSRRVRELLSRSNIHKLRRAEIEEVVAGLNCMNDMRPRNRFLLHPGNTTTVIRSAWTDLLYGPGPIVDRMGFCAERLYGFKRSSIQELIGFFAPDKYPLRNLTVNAGLRFFGFNVSAD